MKVRAASTCFWMSDGAATSACCTSMITSPGFRPRSAAGVFGDTSYDAFRVRQSELGRVQANMKITEQSQFSAADQVFEFLALAERMVLYYFVKYPDPIRL